MIDTRRTLLRQYRVLHLCSLGPRPVLEALLAVEAGSDLDDVLKSYDRADSAVYRAVGADRLPIGAP